MAFATHSRPTTAYIRNTHEEGNLIDEPRFEQHPRFEDVSQIVLPLTDVVVTDEYEVRKEFDDRNVYVRYGGWKNDDVAPPYQGSEWFEILKPSFIPVAWTPTVPTIGRRRWDTALYSVRVLCTACPMARMATSLTCVMCVRQTRMVSES